MLVRGEVGALPDLVFAAAAEPPRLAEWLPEPLAVVGVNGDVLIVSVAGRPRQFRVLADFDRLELTWEPLAEGGPGARLRAELAGVGGSVVQLELDCDGVPDGELGELAARLLVALGKSVERELAQD
ncbi:MULTISPECIES: hypothetical protein [Actinosynnema]|uniref:SRPBCC family protein n=1 Tax=Actinosynnema pretiosum TaxID=42197 RepID=A0A290ZB19_9PSEU|nr:hypothetical protein [Actinosynnema pretiosum]ATE56185.1 hypothetical protein CNX65_25330 [Actinosynnema pretiosum]